MSPTSGEEAAAPAAGRETGADPAAAGLPPVDGGAHDITVAAASRAAGRNRKRMVQRKVAAIVRRRQFSASAVLVLALLSACGTAPPSRPAAADSAGADSSVVAKAPPSPSSASAVLQAAQPPYPSSPGRAGSPSVVLGVDVLLRDSLSLVRGLRVGLITNHTGRSYASPAAGDTGVSTIDLLSAAPGVRLVALFSPEHGIRGEVDRKVASGQDARTGLPVHSLYGETRKPTPAMLEGLDVLVFDIQDIGTRYYSYVWTMALAMEAAADAGLRFVVLDRPDPIGGVLVQGNVAPSYSPVAFYRAAMRHGLTAGELARYVKGEYGLGVDLHVVPMEGWRREMWWGDTGVPWRAPSPNMPSVESATHYPGTCLFEGTNLSVGRGTPLAFQQIGAPWLDAEAVADALRGRRLPGVAIEAVRFTPRAPTDGKFDAQALAGLRFQVTDPDAYDPVRTAVAALLEITRRHPDAFRWREAWFDGLAGGPRLREQIQAGATLDGITAPWKAQRERWEALRSRYLLYR